MVSKNIRGEFIKDLVSDCLLNIFVWLQAMRKWWRGLFLKIMRMMNNWTHYLHSVTHEHNNVKMIIYAALDLPKPPAPFQEPQAITWLAGPTCSFKTPTPGHVTKLMSCYTSRPIKASTIVLPDASACNAFFREDNRILIDDKRHLLPRWTLPR